MFYKIFIRIQTYSFANCLHFSLAEKIYINNVTEINLQMISKCFHIHTIFFFFCLFVFEDHNEYIYTQIVFQLYQFQFQNVHMIHLRNRMFLQNDQNQINTDRNSIPIILASESK